MAIDYKEFAIYICFTCDRESAVYKGQKLHRCPECKQSTVELDRFDRDPQNDYSFDANRNMERGFST